MKRIVMMKKISTKRSRGTLKMARTTKKTQRRVKSFFYFFQFSYFLEEDKDSYDKEFDKLIDESSNDSKKECTSKLMHYQPLSEIEGENTAINEPVIFLPRTQGKGKLFFSTHSFYLSLRFFYTLYERMLKAYELSFEITKNKNTAKFTEQVTFLKKINFLAKK